jgi:hypothetical protein
MNSADMALLRQAQRHLAAVLEAAPDRDLLRVVAEAAAAQSALATIQMRDAASRYPDAAAS